MKLLSSFMCHRHNAKQQSYAKNSMIVKHEATENAQKNDKSREDSCVSTSCSFSVVNDPFSDSKIRSSPSSSIPISLIKRGYSVTSSPTSSVTTEIIDIKDKDEDTTEMINCVENQAISTALTYGEITKLLGENTVIDDYLWTLFEEEKTNNSLLWYNKSQCKKSTLHSRRNAIEWMRNTSMQLKLRDTTLFKSIYYFDKLCSMKQMNPVHIILVAAVCLFIASKFNEREYDVPDLSKISRACGYEYCSKIFISSEMKILSTLDFKLKIVLPIDFIDHYIHQTGVVFHDDIMDQSLPLDFKLKRNLKHDLRNFCVFFLHISNLCYSFWKYKPSVLAFAVICAARRAMRIVPYFNRKLATLCEYEPKDVDKCFKELWGKYQVRFPEKAKQFESFQPKSLMDF